MAPRVLVTRPRDDALDLAAALEDRGYVVDIEPMLTIEPTGAPIDLSCAQAVLATSANGVRALAAATERRDVTLYAVGDATARAAEAAGFPSVVSAGRDADALAALVAGRLDPASGPIVQVSAEDIARDLAGMLAVRRFDVRRVALYRARAADAFTPQTAKMMRDGAIDAVMFFSPRTARTFVKLATDAGLAPACGAMAAICLSEAVARAARGCVWRVVRVAARPERAALIEALDAWKLQQLAGSS